MSDDERGASEWSVAPTPNDFASDYEADDTNDGEPEGVNPTGCCGECGTALDPNRDSEWLCRDCMKAMDA